MFGFKRRKREKELKEFEKILDDVEETLDQEVIEMFRKAQNESFTFELKRENDKTSMAIAGGRLTLLINIAGALKMLQKKLECSDEEFEFIKSTIGDVEGECFETKEEFEKALNKDTKPKKRGRKPKNENNN